ncbi:MAG: universal stress protein [Rhodocyclaceae bacterium]|nr:universal stress protein [Rhodocyclaceae bacterium]
MNYAIKTILFATDLGPHSEQVLAHAAGMAQRFGAELHLLTVMHASNEPSMVALDSYLPEDVVAKLRTDAAQRIRDGANRLLDGAGNLVRSGLVGSVQVREGNAAENVLAEARRIGADLIVLGSHGHTPLGEMLIGSVAQRVSAKSTVPVLLVPINH